MKCIHSPLLACFVSAMLFASGATLAHGDAHTKMSAATKKEQKDWGIAGDAKAVKRTIVVRMLDTMRFTPDRINVQQGETIKLVIKNTGAVLHEFVIGTQKENDEHAALMLKFPDMEHAEPYMAHVSAGKTGEIIWTFNKAGEFDFAGLVGGHYQAGMVGKIKVVSK